MALLGELARELGLPLEGDPALVVQGVATPEDATPEDLIFVHDLGQAGRLAGCRARAVLAPPALEVGERSVLRSVDPRADFSRAAKLLVSAPEPLPGVHPTAFVASTAELDASASVGPHCVLGDAVVVGARCVLHAGVVLDPGVHLGSDCTLHARSVVTAASRLGDRVVLQPGAVVGGAGFGYAGRPEGGLEKIHDLGSVVIEDDVEVGANTCIDRGALGDTRIGRGTKIDDLVMVGHNCVIGEDVVIVAQAGLAGSTVVDDGAVILAQAGIAGHLQLGAGAVIGAQSGVHRDVPAGTSVLGTPERPGRLFHKEMAALGRLPDLLRRVRDLERVRDEASDDSES